MELIVRNIQSQREFQDEVYKLNETSGLFEPKLPVELLKLRELIKDIIFLTGNKNKLAELQGNLHLEGIKLSCPQEKIDLPEIQDSNILNIVQDKCQRASEFMTKCQVQSSHDHDSRSKGFILVEDTSLNFEALHGMPGPYVKWFLEAIGPEGLFRMLTGFSNRAAEAICIYALMVPNSSLLKQQQQQPSQNQGDDSSRTEGHSTILFFRGLARGQVVEPRRGNPTMGWGWDPIFEEERSRLSFAEMGPEVKSKFSHRAAALNVLRTFFEI